MDNNFITNWSKQKTRTKLLSGDWRNIRKRPFKLFLFGENYQERKKTVTHLHIAASRCFRTLSQTMYFPNTLWVNYRSEISRSKIKKKKLWMFMYTLKWVIYSKIQNTKTTCVLHTRCVRIRRYSDRLSCTKITIELRYAWFPLVV